MQPKLLAFSVKRVLLAERAIFHEFEPVGRILLIFVIVVVALFAFGASQSDLHTILFFCCHNLDASKKITLAIGRVPYNIITGKRACQYFLRPKFPIFFILVLCARTRRSQAAPSRPFLLSSGAVPLIGFLGRSGRLLLFLFRA